MEIEKIESMEQAKRVLTELQEKLKNTKDGIEKKDIKLVILDVKQKVISLERKLIADEKKKMVQRVKQLNSVAARKRRTHWLICTGLGALYQQNKIADFENACLISDEAVEEFVKTNFGYDKDRTK